MDVKNLIENEINDVKSTQRHHLSEFETSRDQLVQQAQTFAFSLGPQIVDEFQMCHCDEMKNSQDSSEILQRNFIKNKKRLEKLLSRPSKFCKDSKGARFYLNSKKQKIYKVESFSSEYAVDDEGNRMKIKNGFPLITNENGEYYLDSQIRKIYTKYFFKDENGRYFIDIHGDRFYKTDAEASEYKLINGQWTKTKDGTYETDKRGMRKYPENAQGEKENEEIMENVLNLTENKNLKSEDIKYIQETIGPAIKKALAAVVIHQPADPINYFANFLHHYRFNQNFFQKHDEELQKFLKFRENLKNEKK